MIKAAPNRVVAFFVFAVHYSLLTIVSWQKGRKRERKGYGERFS